MKRQTILFILAEIAKEMQKADIDRQLYLMERRSINLKKLRMNEEKEFIIDALQAYWVQSIRELSRKDLGYIERKNWEGIKNKSKEVMKKLMT